MRISPAVIGLAVLVVSSVTSPGPARRVLADEFSKIDLLTAEPGSVDLATIDPDRLDLTKEKIKRIDLEKWDLSKIDISKVKDPLAAKWIQKVLKEQKLLDKTLSKYGPGELERLQEQNLRWLQRPAPFVEPTFTRSHNRSAEQALQAAERLDEVLLTQLKATGQDFNPLASDEQFVRRIYLDIAGRIPTLEEAQAFLADKRPIKRRELIDRLLLSADYPSQMFNWSADMLRVADLKSNQGENTSYQAWLMDQFSANRPWSATVADLLTAEGDLVTAPEVGWLVRDGGMPLDSLSNTLTTFLGANVACAQCHDHPFNSYTQRDFYELAAFFGATDVPGKNVRGARKVLKDRYHSVTSVPGKFLEFPEDYKGDDVAPGSRVTPAFAMLTDMAPRAKGSTQEPLGRQDFAAWMTNRKNEQFAATIANRLWAKAFGRAVMEPVTEMDNLDDPEKGHDPRLIHAIAGLIQELNYDLMAFQRVIYNTRAYQSEASVSPEIGAAYFFPGPVLRRMTAEQAWDSLVTLIEGERVNDYQRDRRTLTWSYNVLKPGAVDAIEEAGERGKKIEFDKMISEAEKLSSQLAKEAQSGSSSKRSRKAKAADPALSKPDASLARASERQQPEEDRHFLRQFGQSTRELMDGATLEGGIPQVLMLMNGDEDELLASPDSRVMRLAQAVRSEAEQIDVMYLSFLSRRPTLEERQIISRERVGLGQLVWLLINSREFMFVR